MIFLTSGCHDARHFYKQASSTHTFSTKNEVFGWTNFQTCNIYSNGKHQLLTRMPQVPCVLGGLMLIPIFAIYSL